MTDLQFENLGSFAACQPLTSAGRKWLSGHLGGGVLVFGNRILIDHRYLADIVNGARADGLTCDG